MRARLEALLLVIVLATVGAFVVSFAFGWRPHFPSRPPAVVKPDSTPARDTSHIAIRVEVLNASGTTGLARVATDRLRAAGYDVVYFGNAEKRRGKKAEKAGRVSVVIDRVGNIASAQRLGQVLGITNVTTQRDTSRFVDASVILGKGWSPQR